MITQKTVEQALEKAEEFAAKAAGHLPNDWAKVSTSMAEASAATSRAWSEVARTQMEFLQSQQPVPAKKHHAGERLLNNPFCPQLRGDLKVAGGNPAINLADDYLTKMKARGFCALDIAQMYNAKGVASEVDARTWLVGCADDAIHAGETLLCRSFDGPFPAVTLHSTPEELVNQYIKMRQLEGLSIRDVGKALNLEFVPFLNEVYIIDWLLARAQEAIQALKD